VIADARECIQRYVRWYRVKDTARLRALGEPLCGVIASCGG